MTMQGLPRHGAATAVPATLTPDRIRDLVQTIVFYTLVGLGFGTPIVLTIVAYLTR